MALELDSASSSSEDTSREDTDSNMHEAGDLQGNLAYSV